MVVLIQPVRLLRAARDLDLQREWQSAQRQGLLEQRLLLDPDDPQRGMLWTRWDSLDRARGFQAEVRASAAGTASGRKILASLLRAFRKPARTAASPIGGGALEPVEDPALYVHQDPPAR